MATGSDLVHSSEGRGREDRAVAAGSDALVLRDHQVAVSRQSAHGASDDDTGPPGPVGQALRRHPTFEDAVVDSIGFDVLEVVENGKVLVVDLRQRRVVGFDGTTPLLRHVHGDARSPGLQHQRAGPAEILDMSKEHIIARSVHPGEAITYFIVEGCAPAVPSAGDRLLDAQQQIRIGRFEHLSRFFEWGGRPPWVVLACTPDE